MPDAKIESLQTSIRPEVGIEEEVGDTTQYVETALNPLIETGRYFYAFVALLLVGLSWWAFNVYIQVTVGHGVQGLTTKGAMWGIIVANVVHLIGISHVGIAISASVRIMRLERYKPLARIAEIITLVAMITAVTNIALDVGRPERFIVNVVLYGRWHAPFVWSMTVIAAYVIGSSVYLYLAMRRDLCLCANEIPKRRWLYSLLSIGYSDSEDVRKKHDRTVWWCAVIILPIMVSVHSVYGYVFGLQPGRPGWFNSLQAPYFVLGAVVSGFSAIIVIIAILRRVFHWEEFLAPRMFKGLGIFLGFIVLLYLYFFFSEQLTGQYAAPKAEHAVSNDLLWGRFALVTWGAIIFGLVLPFWALFIQGVNPKICSIRLTVAAAILINIALWFKRFLIVVPSFYHPHLPYQIATYKPTITEWSVLLGSDVFGVFIFVVLIKVLPVIELPESRKVNTGKGNVFLPNLVLPGVLKKFLIFGTLFAGLALMAFGFATREYDYAPVKWLTGIFLICMVPLEVCIVQSKAGEARVDASAQVAKQAAT